MRWAEEEKSGVKTISGVSIYAFFGLKISRAVKMLKIKSEYRKLRGAHVPLTKARSNQDAKHNQSFSPVPKILKFKNYSKCRQSPKMSTLK